MGVRMNKIPIRIYLHTTMIRHYQMVVRGILDEIIASGLYDECDGIFIGALGTDEELPNLKNLLINYPKAQVIAHSTNVGFFEFFTMEHLKHDADTLPKFYALYTHDKGVTSENEQDKLFRQFWLDYMMYFMVTRWRECYHALDLRDLDDYHAGYDAIGCRMVSARRSINHLTHSSGNIHWSDSEYVKTLSVIRSNAYGDGNQEHLNSGHWAEMWMWSGQPIIYTPCNLFQLGFPYDKGTFKEYWEALPNKEKYIL